MKTKKIQVVGKVYDYLANSEFRVNLLYGSAGSSKSWQVAIFLLVEKFLSEQNIRILVCRKTLPSLRKSAYQLMMDRLAALGVKAKNNKTDMTLSFGSNKIMFVSLDDVEKLKSIEGINYVWVEEATEITQADYLQINLRCRGHNSNGPNALYFTFNPIDINHFFKPLTDMPPDNVGVLHTTYHDNQFLDDAYVAEIEGLIDQDETYYKIYALGQWAAHKGLIYSGWTSVKADRWPDRFDEVGYGIDFGFNNATAIVEVGTLDNELYFREIVYDHGLTNTELIARMDSLELDQGAEMVADCAEPDRIEEIYQAGYNIHPADKGPGSVQYGIDVIKSRKCHYHEDSANLYKEYVSYKWREDKEGRVFDEPVKFNDHGMDAIRYKVASSDNVPQVVLMGGRERAEPSSDLTLTYGDLYGAWED